MSAPMPAASVHAGSLILVNAQHAFQAEDTPLCDAQTQTVTLPGTQPPVRLARCAANLLAALLREIGAGDGIVPVSGWRTLQEQRQIYAQSLRENGPDFTRRYVALPGHSEHQTGLAIDLALAQDEIDFIRPHFPCDGLCGAFRAAAPAFGFVERYPKGKEDVTGIAHEPWHFRYVGVPHAAMMTERGLVLEEYLALLREAAHGAEGLVHDTPRRQARVCYRCADALPPAQLAPSPGYLRQISGDNIGGFLVTEWRSAP